jgi:ABC-type multidrug transport system fused ATPase/permease subunit
MNNVPDRPSAWRFVLRRLARHKAAFGLSLLWSVVFVLVPMQVPVITGSVIDSLRGKHVRLYGFKMDPEKRQRNVEIAALALLAVAATRGLSAYLRQMSINKLTCRFVSETRDALIGRVTLMPLKSQFELGAGELLHRVVVDTSALRRFINDVLMQGATNIFRVTFPVVLLFLHEALLAAVVCSVIPVQWALNYFLQRKAQAARLQVRRTQSRFTTLVKEQLDGTETIQSLGACEAAIDRARRKVERIEQEQLVQADCSAMKSAVIWSMTSLGFALTWGLGGLRVLEGHMTPGELVSFSGLVAFAYVPFRRFAGAMDASRKVMTSLQRVGELLNLPTSPMERPGARPVAATEGRMELRNVTFGYGQQLVLQNAQLILEPRCLTAIAGCSGSGKTSLLRLLNRLYDPTEGQVLIDGTDVREFTLASLRSAVAMVPQRPMIFSGTIAANLRLARPEATDAELLAACEAADLLEFVRRLPEGLETRIGRQRPQLSGGEAQRLAIARALLMRSKVLLLDEPTSALDLRSQATIMDTLARLKAQMTIVVAGHRLEVLSQADRLIILDHGRLIEQGTPAEMISAIALCCLPPARNSARQSAEPAPLLHR